LWKQNANLGRKNNQNFVCIPHARFVQQLSYKAKLVGIKVLISEESYTSVASFLDRDPIPVYGEANSKDVKFSGRRISTKLYRAGNGLLIHADVNGSLNILRKVVPTAFSLGIEGVVVRPVGVIPGAQRA
ncbi:zinc ribbon domain-containing protein, partial [Nostoc linckia]